jgi:hypothetical protein
VGGSGASSESSVAGESFASCGSGGLGGSFLRTSQSQRPNFDVGSFRLQQGPPELRANQGVTRLPTDALDGLLPPAGLLAVTGKRYPAVTGNNNFLPTSQTHQLSRYLVIPWIFCDFILDFWNC